MEVDIRKNQLKRRKKFSFLNIFGLFQTNSPDPMIEIFSVGFPDFVPNF